MVINAFTTEKHLMTDKDAREAYKGGIINDVIWVRHNLYLADEMTKAAIMPKLVETLHKDQ